MLLKSTKIVVVLASFPLVQSTLLKLLSNSLRSVIYKSWQLKKSDKNFSCNFRERWESNHGQPGAEVGELTTVLRPPAGGGGPTRPPKSFFWSRTVISFDFFTISCWVCLLKHSTMSLPSSPEHCSRLASSAAESCGLVCRYCEQRAFPERRITRWNKPENQSPGVAQLLYGYVLTEFIN